MTRAHGAQPRLRGLGGPWGRRRGGDTPRTVPHALPGSRPGRDARCIPAVASVQDRARHNLPCHGIPAGPWQRGKWHSAQCIPAVRGTSLSIAPCTAHPRARHCAHHIPTRGASLPRGTSPCTVHPCPHAWHITAAGPTAAGRRCWCCSGCFSNKNKVSARSPALAPSSLARGPWGLPRLSHRALQAGGLRCPGAWRPMGVPEPPHGC